MKQVALIAILDLAISGVAAAQVLVGSDITTSTTWTSNNVYDLQAEIRVRNGATLTIEPGTVIASSVSGAALVITTEGTIMALGTRRDPIIFTSDDDRATWIDGDPRNGHLARSSRGMGKCDAAG